MDIPLVPVGGQASNGRSITIMMHEGYDILSGSLESYIGMVRDFPPGTYLLRGKQSKPWFWWPVYALVQ